MTQSKFSPAHKAALLKKFKNRQASKVEALKKVFDNRGYVMQITVTQMPDGQIKVDVPNGMPIPVVLGYLETAKILIGSQMLTTTRPGPPQLIEAPAGVLGPNGRIPGLK